MPSAKALTVPATYAELRRAVQGAMIHGQRAVDDITIQDVPVEGASPSFFPAAWRKNNVYLASYRQGDGFRTKLRIAKPLGGIQPAREINPCSTRH